MLFIRVGAGYGFELEARTQVETSVYILPSPDAVQTYSHGLIFCLHYQLVYFERFLGMYFALIQFQAESSDKL